MMTLLIKETLSLLKKIYLDNYCHLDNVFFYQGSLFATKAELFQQTLILVLFSSVHFSGNQKNSLFHKNERRTSLL